MLLNKSIPIHVIERRSATHARELYIEQLRLEASKRDVNEISVSVEPTHMPRESSVAQTRNELSDSKLDTAIPSSNRRNPTLPVLRVWLSHSIPFLTQGEIFQLAGLGSGSTQAKLKRILLGEGLICEHRLQKDKNYLLVWEPTRKAYDLLNIPVPTLPSKGGWLHKFGAFHISRWAATQGYLVDVEFLLPNGKAVDLVLRRGSETVFVEVAISKPLSKEINNVVLDLEAGLQPDRMIIAVADSKAKKSMDQLLKTSDQLASGNQSISVEFIGNFVELKRNNSKKGA